MSLVTLAPTMSTREIADLIGKQHSNIKISAERLSASGVIGTLAAQEFTHNGNKYVEYLLNKRDSVILTAQNCPEFTARIVDRWQELEAQVAAPAPAFHIPTTLSGALRLAAEQAEVIEKQQAQLEAAAPAVEFVDKFVHAEGLKGFREVCKLLKANEARFAEFVIGKKIMYRLGGRLTAHQQHIDAGRFEVRAGVAAANEHAYTTTKFTPKGVNWIAGEWAKHCLADDSKAA